MQVVSKRSREEVMAEDNWTAVYSGIEPQAQVTPWSSGVQIVHGLCGGGGGAAQKIRTRQNGSGRSRTGDMSRRR